MKKLLLLSATLLFSAGMMAQSTGNGKLVRVGTKQATQIKIDRIDGISSNNVNPVKNVTQDLRNRSAQAIQKTYIGTSANCFSVLLPEQTGLSANEETGLIMMTHRQDATVSSGNIQCSFSVDGGFSFDNTTTTIWEAATSYPARYPSGVIYNPSGNTTPTNAYAVSVGPLIVGSNWDAYYRSSESFAGTNGSFVTVMNSTDTVGGSPLNYMPRMYMQAKGDKIFLYGGNNVLNSSETAYTSILTTLNIGTWNTGTNSVDWVRVGHTPAFVSPVAGDQQGWGYPAMTFNNDGTIGYLVYTGRDADASDLLSYIPVIYKTSDGGLTWTKQPSFDWTTCADVATLATDLSDVNRPYFGSAKEATIDANGYLHFISYVHGAASNNADSLTYITTFTGMQGIVLDVFQTATGWDAMIVDTVFAKDPEEATTLIDPSTTDYVVWDERFQMSKTADGSKIVYAWMDTDASLSEVNIYPDVLVRMYDVATGVMGPKVNLTAGTDYDAMNYWMYMADVTFDKGSYYQLNISTSTLETNSNNPVDHEYITGAYLDETGNFVTSVNELPLEASIALYPNPTSGDLNISFNDIVSGNYNVVVFNTIGSAVISQNIDVNGAVVRTINMNELPTGIYMVQVSNENGSTTKKVIKN